MATYIKAKEEKSIVIFTRRIVVVAILIFLCWLVSLLPEWKIQLK